MRKRFSPVKVGIGEFATSSDYCGKELFPLQEVLLKLVFLEEMTGKEEDLLTFMINGGRNGEILMSPDIRARRQICQERQYPHFSEVVLVGGRRSGKGHITGLAGAYKLWRTREIPDPAGHFHMDVDKEIEFTCIAASFEQAKTRQFADLQSSITRCKALQPYTLKNLDTIISVQADTDIQLMREIALTGRRVTKEFAKFNIKPLAANADTLRGSASIFTVYDEMAFMLPGESRSSAQEVYTAAEPSLAQFGPQALVFCNSSPYSKIGQFYTQWELAMRPQDSDDPWYPMRFVIEFPSWALYDKWWYKPPTNVIKQPLMVSPDWRNQLEEGVEESKLDTEHQHMRDTEALKEQANPDTYKVEYRGLWAEVLDAYLQPEKVDFAYNGILPDGRPCIPSGGSTYLLAPFMGHCDPSSTTAGFGFALGHVEVFDPTPDEKDIWGEQPVRHVVFDRVHRWDPMDFPQGAINYVKIRQELTEVCQLYRPTVLSFDQYNSPGLIAELRQACGRVGIADIRFPIVNATAPVNWNRWEAFKTALYLGLVHIPPNCLTGMGSAREFNHSEWSKQELKHLQLVQAGQNYRVDKQEIGPVTTKDIADCIAEVTLKFLGSYLGDIMTQGFGKARMIGGSEGGYPLGGRQHGGPMNRPSQREGASRFNDTFPGQGGSTRSGFNVAQGINRFRRRGR